METREEKLATWTDPLTAQRQSIRVLQGSLPLNPNHHGELVRVLEDRIQLDQLDDRLLNTSGDGIPDLWRFKAISFPRLKPGRLKLSIPKQVFQRIQDSWNLHPRTIEVFLSNNGVFTKFHSASNERTFLLLKVANSRSTGFDCVSVTCDPSRRTIHALYHHLENEASVFAALRSTPERCVDPYFFVAALYRSHHQHIETHRNTIDDAIQGIERQTGFGNPGRLPGSGRRPSRDEYPALADPKSVNQQLSYCHTDVAALGHVARCCLDCGEWLIQAIDEEPLNKQPPGQFNTSRPDPSDQQFVESSRAVRSMIRQDVEYVRRRTAMLLSQVQAIKERVESQTGYVSSFTPGSCLVIMRRALISRDQMLSAITQNDAEYTAAIAVDGKRDNIAMKTIAILGIVFLPGTFVATLFSINMFDWGGGDASSLAVSPNMWIYWVITVPLTVVTFLIWLLWSRSENIKSSKRLVTYRANAPMESKGATTQNSNLISSEKMV